MRKVSWLLLGVFLGWFADPLPVFSQPAARDVVRRGGRGVRPRFVPNHYMVFLEEPPVASRYGRREQMETSAAGAYRARIQASQRNLARDLAARNILVTGSADTLLNVIFVVVAPDRVAELRGLPGVLGVMPERVVRKNLNKATALANAPAAWANAAIGGPSNAGSGIKIAILDTGIDQNHPAFQDASLIVPPGFPKCNAPSDCQNFTNNKVIVARSYVPQIAAQSSCAQPTLAGCKLGAAAPPDPATSSPDDYSARDRDGHGTFVAAAAAGNQNSAGSMAFSGVAPKAYLGSYKIWGSPGVNDAPPESVWIQALEDALKDGMDIVNMSSGATAFTGALDTAACGNSSAVPCDPLAAAFEAAAQAGLVITVAVGDGGDAAYNAGEYYPNFNSIMSPATAPSVIGVGATLNSHVLGSLVSVEAANAPSSLKSIAAQRSDSYFGYDTATGECCASSGLVAPLVDVTGLGDNGLACAALPAGSLNGKFALIQQGGASSCTLDLKTMNAQNAGAVGVILYMDNGSAPGIPEGVNIWGPAVMISLADGQALKSYIDANAGANVLIDTAGLEQTVSPSNVVASYSSFGPTPDGLIKPDLVAPGGYDANLGSADPSDQYLPAPNGIYGATQSYDQNGFGYSATGYTAMDGTSFSAPLVAGAAALVKQAHPHWTAGQIKSALTNYAAQDVTSDDFDDPVDVEWLGAGRLDANAALNATVSAEPATLSFGYPKPGVALSSSISVTVTNLGSAAVTLAVAVVRGVSASGTTVNVDQSSITMAAGAHTTLLVSLSGSAPEPGSYNGAVTLKSSAPGVSMRIPYMFLAGDGVPLNAVPLFGCCYGAVGMDLGMVPIQVTDQYGVPVAGAAVAWTATPAGSVTLQSVAGKACSPASSATLVTCATDSYGIAWVDVVGGTAATGNATICATAGNYSCADDTGIEFNVTLIPVPNISTAGVVNLGSSQPPVAPGSYVDILGSNLMDPTWLGNSSGDLATYFNLPMTLDGVTVSFDAPATGNLPAVSVPGYVNFASPSALNVFVPWELENYSSAQVKVTFDEFIYSNLVNVALANYVPVFLMNNGMADAWDGNTGMSITASNPATCGQNLQLYAVGLGPVTNQPPSGIPALASPLSQTTAPVTVIIGGTAAQVAGGRASLVPQSVGLYQVNVQSPPGLGAGNQAITISAGGQTSPATSGGSTVYLPVAVCTAQFFTLTATKSGSGTGTVTSSPAFINCGGTCSAQYPRGAQVTLTATPDAGSSFGGWSGSCSGTGTCTVTMNAAGTVTASFNKANVNTASQNRIAISSLSGNAAIPAAAAAATANSIRIAAAVP